MMGKSSILSKSIESWTHHIKFYDDIYGDLAKADELLLTNVLYFVLER